MADIRSENSRNPDYVLNLSLMILLTIVWILALVFAMSQRSKYKNLVQAATEPEEIAAYKKIIDKHTTRAVIYGIILGINLILWIVMLSAPQY
jgi:uncharacterized membrane protein